MWVSFPFLHCRALSDIHCVMLDRFPEKFWVQSVAWWIDHSCWPSQYFFYRIVWRPGLKNSTDIIILGDFHSCQIQDKFRALDPSSFLDLSCACDCVLSFTCMCSDYGLCSLQHSTLSCVLSTPFQGSINTNGFQLAMALGLHGAGGRKGL